MEQFHAAGELIDAINNLPPTYTLEEHCGGRITQFIPDPVSPAALEGKLQDVERAEAQFNASMGVGAAKGLKQGLKQISLSSRITRLR